MIDYEQQFEIPVDGPPQRIVSLVPSMTESLFDLGLGDRVVGITDSCVHPADQLADIVRVGGTKQPDVSRIIDLQPDLIIANQEENGQEDVEALQAAGIPVWVTFPKTVPDVFNMLWNIMNVFEETAMVARIRLIEQTYDWVGGISKAREDNPCRVFVPIGRDPWMTCNKDTYLHDLLMICGGLNVFTEHECRYPRVTLEEIIAAQPDVILLPDEPYEFTAADIPFFAGLDVPAAHNDQIKLVYGSLLTWAGTRVSYALNDLPPLLCSWDETS